MRIPTDITPLSYIAGSGSQYIETAIHLLSTDVVKSKWRFQNSAGNVYGCFTSSSDDDNFCLYAGSASTNAYIRYNGQLVRDFKATSGTVYEIEQGPDGFFVGGSKVADFDAATFTCSAPMYIFMLPNSTSAKVTARCYYLQVIRDGEVAYDFIPARNEATGEVGMWEAVHGVWYGKSGTGDFTAGSAIARVLGTTHDGWRRRLMAACAKHYEPIPGSDGRLWAYYVVTDSNKENHTILFQNYGINYMEVDGVQTSIATKYSFPTAGRHLIKFGFNPSASSSSPSMFNNTDVREVYFPLIGSKPSMGTTGNQFLKGCAWLKVVRGPAICLPQVYSTAATREETNEYIADVDIWNVAYWLNGVMHNNIKRLRVVGTFASIPNNGLQGTNGQTSNYKFVWLESPNLASIGNGFCKAMSKLETLVINVNTPPTLGSTDAFRYTNTTFKIYVPYSSDHSILDAYKAASVWSNWASQIYELNSDGTIPTA